MAILFSHAYLPIFNNIFCFNVGGFYRHLYEQKMGTEKDAEIINPSITKHEEPKSKEQIDSLCSHQETSESSRKRNYRKRKSSSENKKQLSEGEVEDSDDEIHRLNLDDIRQAKKNKLSKENIDADSDFSIDESSDDDLDDKKRNDIESPEDILKKSDEKEVVEKVIRADTLIDNKNSKVVNEIKPKVDIWKKRTVGEVLQHAIKRYYERKAARCM